MEQYLSIKVSLLSWRQNEGGGMIIVGVDGSAAKGPSGAPSLTLPP